MKLYNTETKKKQPISDSDKVTIYTCGPTVYHFVHIGNLRTFVFEDLLRRSIKYFGKSVFHVMNITDVDDKTINGAIEKNTTLEAFTKPYIKAFFDDLKTLNVEPCESYPKATDHIQDMIELIKDLIKKGYAYIGKDNSVYFRISEFSSYGRLSHLCLDDLKCGASNRVDCDEYDKESVSDFVLWKAYDKSRDGEIFWESPFGRGRPGWHIECSAMAMKIIGETVDIHVGAVDNIFPHHENEIAQSEACTGKTFAKLWLHAEHLIVDGKKMSKSLGNFYTLRDLLDQGYKGLEIRYLLLSTHYKTQLNFTNDGLKAARSSLQRVQDFIFRLQEVELLDDNTANSDECNTIIKEAKKLFDEALSDDLNISKSLAALFDMIRQINTLIDSEKLGAKEALDTLKLLKSFNSVIGCFSFDSTISYPEDVLALVDLREKARSEKRWEESDKLRDDLLAKGYIIEDSKQGPKLKKKDPS